MDFQIGGPDPRIPWQPRHFQQYSAAAAAYRARASCNRRISAPGHRHTRSEFQIVDLWQPNSPDLNLVSYYKIWVCFQERVHQKRVYATSMIWNIV